MHEVVVEEGESLLYVDLHLLHEVTSPQAFAAIEEAGRIVRRPDRSFAMADHNVPTFNQHLGAAGVADALSGAQLQALAKNCQRHGITLFNIGDIRNGIVHVVGPEMGLTQPGMTIVCGDSHTATHGALGAFAMGVGTSDVEHVMATQMIRMRKPRNMRVSVEGALSPHVSAKDLALHIIRRIGVSGGNGHVIEYAGPAIDALTIEGRLTLCNMSIEAGARCGLVAPDEKTFAYIRGRPYAPTSAEWPSRIAQWKQLRTDPDAIFDCDVCFDADGVAPMVTWGTSPGQAIEVTGQIPDPAMIADDEARGHVQRALDYMGLTAGTELRDVPIDCVFIGSCTNGRIEDLREAAAVVGNRRISSTVRAMVVPGSGQVAQMAEAEGLADIFRAAGFAWRQPGCSMCTAMNGDELKPGERCASTSNRNFENRQGIAGRTHLMSPAMAAAAALTGHIADVRDFLP